MNKLNGIVERFALYKDGERITDFEYEEVKEKNGVYILWNKKQVVLYDKETMTKKLEINDNILCLFFKKDYFIVRINDGKDWNSKVLTNAAYSYDGKVLIEPYKYTDVSSFEKVIVVYSKPRYDELFLYGLDGNPLITPVCSFEDVLPGRKGVVVTKNGKVGMYSYKGELLVPIEYGKYTEVLKIVKDKEVEIIDEEFSEHNDWL